MFNRKILGHSATTSIQSRLAQLLFKLPFSSLFLLAWLCTSAQAATVTVNTTKDTDDGVCSTAVDGCSLREALTVANTSASSTINFNIPSSDAGYNTTTGVYTINLQTSLPTITANGTVISGSSQTGFGGDTNPNGPEVQVLGLIGNVSGSGWVLNGFKINNGLLIGANNCSISDLILNNFRYPVVIDGDLFQAGSNMIRGCYIGTDHSGTTAMPNLNNDYKIGISVQNSSNNIIGGSNAGQGNSITGANFTGVNIGSGTGNSIRGNSIFKNGYGIRLLNYNVITNANDNDDLDSGSNNFQNLPVITGATTASGNTSVALSLQSSPNKIYVIDVYRQPASEIHRNGFGEGKIYIGTANLTTNGDGNGTTTLTAIGTFPTESFTAAATDPDGNTSEFSFAFATGGSPLSIVTNTNDSGSGSFRAAIEYANANPLTTISFAIPNTDSGYNPTTGVYTIRVASPLPFIATAGTVIDGGTQTNLANTNQQGPEIELTSNGYAPYYRNDFGLNIEASNCSIKNLIVNGFQVGIGIWVDSYLNTVHGCYIGTDSTGTVASPNNYRSGETTGFLKRGISIVGTNNTIGGFGAGESNRIAFATGPGVEVVGFGNANSIRGNSIFKNGLGIDLYGNGVTPNDTGDFDSGYNSLQNFPVITAVTEAEGNTSVALSLNTFANHTFTIDVYRSPLADVNKTGFGEGKTYAGTVNITTDANGNGTATAIINGSIGTDIVSATATDPSGTTSEFSFAASLANSSPLVVVNTANDGFGSFRKAIEYASTISNGTISFNIPTSDRGYNAVTGVWTISPLSHLPRVGNSTVIDGSSQPGNTNPQGPEIEINGSSSVQDKGISTGESTLIRGLIINGYSTPIWAQSQTRIESCYIGTDHTGTSPSPNNSTHNSLMNCIEMRGPGNIIGGDTPDKGNIIGFASNTTGGNGISVSGYGGSNFIRNNTILGNYASGIHFNGPIQQNMVLDNTIRDNGGAGIGSATSYSIARNTMRFNSIYNNGGLGIDMGTDGVTPNDIGDIGPRSSLSKSLNFPVLTGITSSGNNLTVTGTYNSYANSTYEIDFYGNTTVDSSGYGEGRSFLGTVSVTTDGSGNANFSKALTVTPGSSIAATATAINTPLNSTSVGETSEFSNNIALSSSIQLSSSSYSVNETSSSITINVVRQAPFNGAVTVNYTTSNGASNPATAGSDYTATTGTLNWADGDGANKTIVVPINNDTLDEGDETFNVTLSQISGSALLGTPSNAIVTIIDNDTAGSFTLKSAIYSVNEDASTVTLTVARGNSTSNAASVNYSTSDGTTNSATAGSDYTATSGTLNWSDGDSSDKSFTIAIKNDNLPELDETFKVTLSEPNEGNALGSPVSAVVTILDNDHISVLKFSSSTYTVNESTSTATLTVVREESARGAVSIKYVTVIPLLNPASLDSDFTPVSGTLNWADGDGASKTISVPINNDTLDEVDESFEIMLFEASAGASAGTPYNASVTIVDNDANSTIKLKASSYRVNENAGSANITVTRESVSAKAVSVNYSTGKGGENPATAGTDYTSKSGTLNWADGDRTDKTITVPIGNDTIYKGNKTFNITLSGPSVGASIDTPASAIVTIVDDEAANLTIEDASTTEGDTKTKVLGFTVRLSHANSRPVSVNYATTVGANSPASIGTDYLSISGNLNFAAGELTKTIPVSIVGDKRAEPLETFRVVLSNPTNATITRNTAIGTILDDDSKASISISDAEVVEGDSGTANALFTIRLANAVGRAVTLKYATHKGTATSNADFVSSSGTLSFAIGETTKTISVAVKGDTIDELNEQFSVKLSSATNAKLADATGTATIVDDDTTLVLNVSGSSVLEGNKGKTSLNFMVSLNRASSRTVKVNVKTVAALIDPATVKTDYVEIKPKALSFKPGETSKIVAVSVVSDSVFEANERVRLQLSTPMNALIGEANAEGVIINDDGVSAKDNDDDSIEETLPTLSIDDAQIVEGNSGTKTISFTLTLSKQSERAVSVAFATANVTAIAGSDYESIAGNLTFAPGETLKTIAVTIKGDLVRESDEQLKLVLSRSINAILERSIGTGTIINDDVTKISAPAS
jgi:CSLREA domain-containing protein